MTLLLTAQSLRPHVLRQQNAFVPVPEVLLAAPPDAKPYTTVRLWRRVSAKSNSYFVGAEVAASVPVTTLFFALSSVKSVFCNLLRIYLNFLCDVLFPLPFCFFTFFQKSCAFFCVFYDFVSIIRVTKTFILRGINWVSLQNHGKT